MEEPLPMILNVDDYDPGRYARTKILVQAGFQVIEAATAKEALEKAVAEKPQLILLDVNLPDMNGLDVCELIKTRPETSHIAVLQISASCDPKYGTVRALNNGADYYIAEPVDPAVLIATVRALLRARDAEDRLRKSGEELQYFSYMLSHELSEPLRTVDLYLQRLSEKCKDQLDSEANECIHFAMTSAARMQSFIRDVLIYSQAVTIESGFAAVPCETVLLTAMMNLHSAIRESGARITHDPLPVVRCNEMKLVHVFQNLIGNAIKYRRDAPPSVHIAVKENGKDWVFSVADNGQGIEPQYKERIFGVFKRLHGREIQGSGLGLALCKRIVEAHGGSIWVESVPGAGSTFCFSLPRTVAEDSSSSFTYAV